MFLSLYFDMFFPGQYVVYMYAQNVWNAVEHTPSSFIQNIEQITQFQRNHISVRLLSNLIRHTKLTMFSTKASFQQLCH